MDPNATWQMLCDSLRALNQHPDDEEIRANVVDALRGTDVLAPARRLSADDHQDRKDGDDAKLLLLGPSTG